jgi:hypothetical protein
MEHNVVVVVVAAAAVVVAGKRGRDCTIHLPNPVMDANRSQNINIRLRFFQATGIICHVSDL